MAVTVSGGTPEARGPPAPSAGQVGVPGLSESVNCFCCHFYRYLIEVDSKNETEIIEYIWRYGYGEFYIIFFLFYKPYHVVFVNYEEKIVIKTVYIPDNRFESDYKTRKNGWL